MTVIMFSFFAFLSHYILPWFFSKLCDPSIWFFLSPFYQIGELKTEPRPPAVPQLSALWCTCNPRRKMQQLVSVNSINDKDPKDIVQSIKRALFFYFFLSSLCRVKSVLKYRESSIFTCLITVRQESRTINLLNTTGKKFSLARIKTVKAGYVVTQKRGKQLHCSPPQFKQAAFGK